jgi:hypothetical protein
MLANRLLSTIQPNAKTKAATKCTPMNAACMGCGHGKRRMSGWTPAPRMAAATMSRVAMNSASGSFTSGCAVIKRPRSIAQTSDQPRTLSQIHERFMRPFWTARTRRTTRA